MKRIIWPRQHNIVHVHVCYGSPTNAVVVIDLLRCINGHPISYEQWIAKSLEG